MTSAEWVARIGTCDAARRDAETFLARLPHADLFDHERDIIVARAPGRLDVMGGIADYSGALVVEWPVAEATFVALQRDPHPFLTVVSGSRRAAVECPALLGLDYDDARKFFAAERENFWMAYIAGALIVLAREHGVEFSGGARILVGSTVPEGKGVSSSAALEVAAMTAISATCRVPLEPCQLALLCQKVENLIAGAPCGVMDQMTAALGVSGRLSLLLCQPAEVRGCLALPPGLALWGIDSGIQHAVTSADYRDVRIAAFMGHRILEDLIGEDVDYLANVAPKEFETFAPRLPELLTGREFLDRYHGTHDTITTVDPAVTYHVRSATTHPIHEHARANEFAALVSRLDGEGGTPRFEMMAERLGELMYESHASYSACGLGSDGTDRLVRLVKHAGCASGLYGAKITGGGRGGTVAILGRRDARAIVHGVAARYARELGRPARVFSDSSPGSAACGVHVLRLQDLAAT